MSTSLLFILFFARLLSEFVCFYFVCAKMAEKKKQQMKWKRATATATATERFKDNAKIECNDRLKVAR